MTPVRLINKAVKRLRQSEEFLTRQVELHGDKITVSELEYVKAIPSMISFLECASRSHWHRTVNNPGWHGQAAWQDTALDLARVITGGSDE